MKIWRNAGNKVHEHKQRQEAEVSPDHHDHYYPKTPGVKVGSRLRWQRLFVSKYISKVSDFCGNAHDSGVVQVTLELRLHGGGGGGGGAGVDVCTFKCPLLHDGQCWVFISDERIDT